MADLGHPHAFRHKWRGLVVSPIWNRHDNGWLDSHGSRRMTWQYQTRMWEVAIKTMYIPWGSLALPKPQAFLGTKFTASSLPKEEGWRLTLRGSWIVELLPSGSGYRQHTDHWLVAEVSDYESWFPRFYSTNIPPSEIVSPLNTGFPIFPRFCSTLPNFLFRAIFNENNLISGLSASLSL